MCARKTFGYRLSCGDFSETSSAFAYALAPQITYTHVMCEKYLCNLLVEMLVNPYADQKLSVYRIAFAVFTPIPHKLTPNMNELRL